MKLDDISSGILASAYKMITVGDLDIITDPDDIDKHDVSFDTDRQEVIVRKDMTFQALYSYAKEEFASKSLIRFSFPFEAITSEQYEIGGGIHADWKFSQNSYKHIKTSGWVEKYAGGNVRKRYMGIVTLGKVRKDAEIEVWMAGNAQAGAVAPTILTFKGPLNEAVEYHSSHNVLYITSRICIGNTIFKTCQINNEDVGMEDFMPICWRFPLSETIPLIGENQ